MTADDLPLGLSAERIRTLASTWDDGGLWDDIAWLALLAWTADGEQERLMRWHHLVMAVGNFKRQGGRRLHPSAISPVIRMTGAVRSDRFYVAGADLTISRDDPQSWNDLQASLKGAAVPTVTSVLAALWPDSHHILDWRVLAAVAGLSVVTDKRNHLGLVDPARCDQAILKLENYAKVRRLLSDMAEGYEMPLSTVERALYKLTTTVQGKGKTWKQYGEELQQNLDRLRPSEPGHDGPSDDEEDLGPSAP